jgi:signal transduction histidine kinase
MNIEMEKGDYNEAKLIAGDIKQNLDKINYHGKRADSIVKGMLQHSRKSDGQKELTDINGLCDEYLRLSYHGLRARDKSFNATLKSKFDDTIGSLLIDPQDFGRVILNLINNAFYAVEEKRKTGIANYEPTVSVESKKLTNKIQIKISDNGGGIPEAVLSKIFQPFFTTKPSGQGTGLGLSLAYDIITKGHGGELTVETVEGEGTTFYIKLPFTN